MYKNYLLIFAMLAISGQHHHGLAEASNLGGSISSVFGNLAKYLELSQALKYGDDCSWEAEEYRQNFTRDKLLNPEVPKNEAAIDLMETVVKRDYKLCSATKLYSCDKESQKCVCGDPGYESVMGRADRAHFTLEDEGKCRWATNSYCAPTDQLLAQARIGFLIDSNCERGSSCMVVNGIDGERCSIQAIMGYLYHQKGLMFMTSPRLISEEIMSGRVCSCQQDEVIQAVTEKTDEDTDPLSGMIMGMAMNDEMEGKENEKANAFISAARRKRSLFMPDNFAELSLVPKYIAGISVRYYD